MWVVSEWGNVVIRVDARAPSPSSSIPISDIPDPTGVALASNTAWVTEGARDAVLRIDVATAQPRGVITIHGQPVAIAAWKDVVWTAIGPS